MSLVFITRPVERHGIKDKSQLRDLGPLLTHVLAGALGGSGAAVGIVAVGLTLRKVDPTHRSYLLVASAAALSIVAIGFQLARRMGPLPERKEQVPRRWLTWKSRSLTAAAYGVLLGGGVFTRLGYPAMYALAATLLVAPNLAAGCAIGAIYGTNRAATVSYEWVTRSFGRENVIGLGAGAPILLSCASGVVAVWMISQLVR
jgi:hypothetical protein